MGNSKVMGGYIVDQAREQFCAKFSPVTGLAGIDHFEGKPSQCYEGNVGKLRISVGR